MHASSVLHERKSMSWQRRVSNRGQCGLMTHRLTECRIYSAITGEELVLISPISCIHGAIVSTNTVDGHRCRWILQYSALGARLDTPSTICDQPYGCTVHEQR